MSESNGEKKAVVYGDSITEAHYLPEAERQNAWTCVVEKRFKGLVKIINEGKGGRPTDSLDEFKEMLERQPDADLLILALGANDARDISGNCVPNALKNLGEMMRLGRMHYGDALKMVIVAPTNINKEALGPSRPIANEREGNLRDLEKAYLQLAREGNCSFASFYGVVDGKDLIRDGVHPDSEGHTAIAEVMEKCIRSVLPL